ncbi:hypothetical protein HK405_011083, partial [Cladochytrium tenue]
LQVQPPIRTNSILQFDPEVVAQDARSTRVVVHARFPALVEAFLDHKRRLGSPHEKAIYCTPEFGWRDEVARLLLKRPLVFMKADDTTVLRDGTRIPGDATKEWDRNGTDQQHRNKLLTLAEYLSYDEIMLSSLMGVSGPSFFVNDGNRHNKGVPGEKGTFEERGIIVGVVGARFHRPGRMDCLYVLPSASAAAGADPADRLRQHPELTQLFHGFFGAARNPDAAFDSRVYKARLRVTLDVFLLEADARAREAGGGRRARAYLVGLGLGVWRHRAHVRQPDDFVEAVGEALTELELPHVGTIELAWVSGVSEASQQRVEAAGASRGVRVLFSERNPAEPLPSQGEGGDGGDGDAEELLVLSYAWDGNAFPGNEYWKGMLGASGDSAAACMSTVAELHNPLLNPDYVRRVKVLGAREDDS